MSPKARAKIKAILNKQNNKVMLKKFQRIKPFEKEKLNFEGINLIGDIKAETGLGQSMRLLANMFQKSNIPFCVIQVNSPGDLEQNDSIWDKKICNEPKYGVNVIHINPGNWAEFYLKAPAELFNCHYNIAYWLWELEDFPEEWIPCIDTLDEIWTPSEFISQSIRRVTKKRIFTIPYSIDLDTDNLYGREYFSLPEKKFLFLVMYDFMSVSERKNPKGAVEAFKLAFKATDESPGLIIKINHLAEKEELTRLQRGLEGYPNIYYITDNLSRKEVESLIATADVFVSLHRAEGFGLPLAEAMYLGTPTIATNWSATTEFMNKECSCLVDYELIKIAKDIGPYKKGKYWADANVRQAADYMVMLYGNNGYYNNIKEKAKIYVKKKLSVDNDLIKERLHAINKLSC